MPTEPPIPATEPPKRRRWRRWLGRSVLVVLVLALLGIGWEYYQWWSVWSAGHTRSTAAVAELDAVESNWRAADLCAARNARLDPPAVNSAYRATAAADLLPQPFNGRASVEWQRWGIGQLPPASDLAALGRQLAEFEPAAAAGRALRLSPNPGIPLVFSDPLWRRTPLPHAQKVFDLAQVLAADAAQQAAASRPSESAAAITAQLTAAASLGDEPTRHAQSARGAIAQRAVQSAEVVLGLCELADGLLGGCQAAFAREADAPRMTHMIRGERAGTFRAFEGVDAGTVSLGDLFRSQKPDGPPPVGAGFADRFENRGDYQRAPGQQAFALTYHGELLAAVSRPHGPERREEWAKTRRGLQSRFDSLLGNGSGLLKPLLIVSDSDEVYDARATMAMRCAIVAMACERFRLMTGRFPKSLAELPKDLLPAIPEDPYTGKPLIFKTTDTGIVIYAVGKDLKDDGGKFAAREEPGTDIGFTLLDSKHRRKPAPEKNPADVPPEE